MLKETLRHDYGPERSRAYFEECRIRLGVVELALKVNPDMDRETVASHMRSLSSLGSRISLIERAHLGEFSWPFAAIVEYVADQLFPEETIDENFNRVLLKPIVHVVAEGTDYQIVNDDMPPPGERHIIIVAFPRQLKHYVLLHAIFGHELAHIAIDATNTGSQMANVLAAVRKGKLLNSLHINQWLRSDSAPPGVKAELNDRPEFIFGEQSLINWRHEIVCDLFGLRLFGPAFAAAHRMIIEALSPARDFFDLDSTTHPPYPIRQRVLATAVDVLGWNKTVSNGDDPELHEAEQALIGYMTDAVENPWFEVLERHEISDIMDEIGRVLEPYGLAYTSPSVEKLRELVARLAQERPPLVQTVCACGEPMNLDVEGTHCLYAGWTYWFGRSKLAARASSHDPRVQELTFLELNRLCDQALLQQRAIHLVNQDQRQARSAAAS